MQVYPQGRNRLANSCLDNLIFSPGHIRCPFPQGLWVQGTNWIERTNSSEKIHMKISVWGDKPRLSRRCWCSVAQLCPTLCNSMDCSPPGSSVCGIFQAKILEWVGISFSRGSYWPRDRTHVSCTAGRFFSTEPQGKPCDELFFPWKNNLLGIWNIWFPNIFSSHKIN